MCFYAKHFKYNTSACLDFVLNRNMEASEFHLSEFDGDMGLFWDLKKMSEPLFLAVCTNSINTHTVKYPNTSCKLTVQSHTNLTAIYCKIAESSL